MKVDIYTASNHKSNVVPSRCFKGKDLQYVGWAGASGDWSEYKLWARKGKMQCSGI